MTVFSQEHFFLQGPEGLSLITWHPINRKPRIAYLHGQALLAEAIRCFALITDKIIWATFGPNLCTNLD